MVAFWLLWLKVLWLDFELDADAGWRVFDAVIGGGNLLVKGLDAYRHVGADGDGLLGRFMARQWLLRRVVEEEERQREIIFGNRELCIVGGLDFCMDLFKELTLEITSC